MKNKIIILMTLFIPLSIFIFLQHITNNTEATALPDSVGIAKLIKFYSPMCSECKTVAKNVEDVMDEYNSTVILEEINAAKGDKKTKDLISKYNVTVVPTLIFVDKEGNTCNKVEGMIQKEEIKRNLDEIK